MKFYAFYLDSSYKTKLAIAEVDLLHEKIINWEPLSDFGKREDLAPNKIYNYKDLNTYLKKRMGDYSNSLIGNLVLYYKDVGVLTLIFTIKVIDRVNWNNCEVLAYLYINVSSRKWTAVFKAENHNYEDNGQILRHSKVYISSG